jgi:hypothetical protein
MWKGIRFGLLLTFLVQPPAMAQTKVDLELVLMADGSGSIDDDEFLLQRHGYARALRDPRIIDAIRYGPLGRIALSYVEWSGPDLHVPIVPWTLIRTKADIAAFADVLLNWPRELYGGGTAVGDAILYGAQSIETNRFAGRRRVIDISGDGPDRNGLPAAMGRDQAVARGMTVNGLPILEGSLWLNDFFTDNVIGGPGAFSIPARGFKDVYVAIRKKLIREIAGNFQNTSVLDQKFVAYTTAFRVHPARRGARRDGDHHKRRATTPGGSEGRPSGRFSRPLGTSGKLADAKASPAPPFLPSEREKRSYRPRPSDPGH